MAYEHTNRCGETYYLQAGKPTKTGKPRYHFGRKLTKTAVEEIPAGFEVYESPERGIVYLRKEKPSRIADFEREFVAEAIQKCADVADSIVDIDGDSLVVYTSSMSNQNVDELFDMLGNGRMFGLATVRASLVRKSPYEKMLRFDLADADERLFTAQRWCFVGSIDNWIFVHGPAPLDELVQELAPHLGQESFFELM